MNPIAIVIIGGCICLAWVVDLLTGSSYLRQIRETDRPIYSRRSE
jgi:hypothetical protein